MCGHDALAKYSWWEISSGSIHSCFYLLSTTLPPLRAGSVPIQPSAIPGRAVLLLSHVGPILHWEGCGRDAVDLAAAATEARRVGALTGGPLSYPASQSVLDEIEELRAAIMPTFDDRNHPRSVFTRGKEVAASSAAWARLLNLREPVLDA